MAEGKKTKKEIAQALQRLCEQKPYHKISVGQIAEEAHINRQTFYYHFTDKQQLLYWIYQQEALHYLSPVVLTLDNWEEQVLKMLTAMREEATFYQATAHGERDLLFDKFATSVQHLFEQLFLKIDHDHELSQFDIIFYSRFFAHGCSGILEDWLHDGLIESPLEIAMQLFRLAKDVEFYSYKLYKEELR